jgi:UrcA family protein
MLKLICAATALLAASTPAVASDLAAPPTQVVSVAGVDFHSAAAVRQVYSQLKMAASSVCDNYAANSRVTQADVACADKAVATAVRTLDRPLLTAMYEGQVPTRLASAR